MKFAKRIGFYTVDLTTRMWGIWRVDKKHSAFSADHSAFIYGLGGLHEDAFEHILFVWICEAEQDWTGSLFLDGRFSWSTIVCRRPSDPEYEVNEKVHAYSNKSHHLMKQS